NGTIGGRLRALDRVGKHRDAQYAPARCFQDAVFQLGAGMEYDAFVGIVGKPADDVAGTCLCRIATGCHDDTQRRTPVPFDVGLVQPASDGQVEDFGEIAFDAHHDGLGFRVAHPAV